MAKVGLTQDQKSHSIFDTENFKLKKDEKARIVILDEEFDVEFVHWVDDFGYAICAGDYNLLLKEGADTQHCKFCANANPDGAIKSARRKFVTLIVIYRTNSKGQVLTPITVDVNPWVFGDDKFNDLLGKKEAWGDLKDHDLMIECLGEQYQKMRIDVMPEAVWKTDKDTAAFVAAAFKDAKSMYGKDLRMLLGRDVSDPEKLAEVIGNATGQGTVPAYADAGSINQMFSDGPAVASIPVAEVDFASMLDDSPAAPVETAPPVSKTPPEVASASSDPLASAAPADSAEPLDFDALLND